MTKNDYINKMADEIFDNTFNNSNVSKKKKKKFISKYLINSWNYEFNKKLVALQLLKSNEIKDLNDSQIHIIQDIIVNKNYYYLDKLSYTIKNKYIPNNINIESYILFGILFAAREIKLYNELYSYFTENK